MMTHGYFLWFAVTQTLLKFVRLFRKAHEENYIQVEPEEKKRKLNNWLKQKWKMPNNSNEVSKLQLGHSYIGVLIGFFNRVSG